MIIMNNVCYNIHPALRLQLPGQEEISPEDYSSADLARLGTFYVETEAAEPVPPPVSRITDRPNTGDQDVDHSLLKDR